MGEGTKASLTPNLQPRRPSQFQAGAGGTYTPSAGLASQRVTVSRMLKQDSSPTQGALDAKGEGTLRDQTSRQGSLCPPQLLRHLGHVSW